MPHKDKCFFNAIAFVLSNHITYGLVYIHTMIYLGVSLFLLIIIIIIIHLINVFTMGQFALRLTQLIVCPSDIPKVRRKLNFTDGNEMMRKKRSLKIYIVITVNTHFKQVTAL